MIYRHFLSGSSYVSFCVRLSLFSGLVYFFDLLLGTFLYLALDFVLVDYIILNRLLGYRLMVNGSDVLFLEMGYIVGFYVTMDRKMEDLQGVKRQIKAHSQGLERFAAYPA